MCKKVWALSEQVMRGYRARASTRADGRTDRQSLLKSPELTISNKDISEHKTTAQTRLTFQTIEMDDMNIFFHIQIFNSHRPQWPRK